MGALLASPLLLSMAPKSRPPPSPSSSSSSSAASSSSSEPDIKPPSQPPAPPASTPQNPKNPNPNPKKSSSSSSGSGSDSGSDSGSESPPLAAKPASTPPAAAADSETDSSADSGSSADSDSPPPPKSAVKAEPQNSALATPAKRKLAVADDNPSAKKLINRVWSTDDEIAVLQGMLEFKSAHNSDPAASIESFHEFIKNNLNLEYSKTQISDKIRRLKAKYNSNLKRSRKGADPSFSKAHEKTAFELSRQIWSKKSELAEREEGEFRVSYPYLAEVVDVIDKEGGGIPGAVIRKSIEKLKPARVKAIEERWGKHFLAVAKMKLERADLLKDLMKTVVGILESSA